MEFELVASGTSLDGDSMLFRTRRSSQIGLIARSVPVEKAQQNLTWPRSALSPNGSAPPHASTPQIHRITQDTPPGLMIESRIGIIPLELLPRLSPTHDLPNEKKIGHCAYALPVGSSELDRKTWGGSRLIGSVSSVKRCLHWFAGLHLAGLTTVGTVSYSSYGVVSVVLGDCRGYYRCDVPIARDANATLGRT
ncbi:hypothetical protein GW17_00013944 [Ensete ventricosum]|nr:hypothetical protein GW17_00013944 [Ensete ventricosum]